MEVVDVEDSQALPADDPNPPEWAAERAAAGIASGSDGWMAMGYDEWATGGLESIRPEDSGFTDAR